VPSAWNSNIKNKHNNADKRTGTVVNNNVKIEDKNFFCRFIKHTEKDFIAHACEDKYNTVNDT
jgi:hypothetical protein